MIVFFLVWFSQFFKKQMLRLRSSRPYLVWLLCFYCTCIIPAFYSYIELLTCPIIIFCNIQANKVLSLHSIKPKQYIDEHVEMRLHEF
jgi:hypothetical protein